VIQIRKLAALDLHFLGPAVILTEFALGVIGPLILGALTLQFAAMHGRRLSVMLFGGYLLTLGVNYVPLLLHAVSLVRSRSVADEIGGELSDRRAAFRRYRGQSLYLLVPLVVPIAAVLQERDRRNSAQAMKRSF
jgi:hypothetical protein